MWSPKGRMTRMGHFVHVHLVLLLSVISSAKGFSVAHMGAPRRSSGKFGHGAPCSCLRVAPFQARGGRRLLHTELSMGPKERARMEGYDDDDDDASDMMGGLSDISMAGLSAMSGFMGGAAGFTLSWDGHDAFVNQNFRLSNKQVAQYIQSMVDLESRNDIEELLLRFGEEPASDMSTEAIGDRLVKLTFLSSGLRQLIEDSILGTRTKVDRSGLLEVDSMADMPDGASMRSAGVSRKMPLTPNARSKGKLIGGSGKEVVGLSGDSKTVEELKAMCRERGLKVGGRKADLVERLREAMSLET